MSWGAGYFRVMTVCVCILHVLLPLYKCGWLLSLACRNWCAQSPWVKDGMWQRTMVKWWIFLFFRRQQLQDSGFLGHSSSWCVTSILWKEATQNLFKSTLNTMGILFHRKKLSGSRVSSAPHTAPCCDCCWVFQSSPLGLISWNWSAWLLWLYFTLLQRREMTMNRLHFVTSLFQNN